MKPRIINLPKIPDNRGNLSFVEENNHIPFKIERSYWIYDVPGGETRGGHAYRENQEFIIALSGSFDVLVHDGEEEHIFTLNRSYYGLYIPKGMWRQMKEFSTNSLALVLASIKYNKEDYIRDYNEFIENEPHNLITPQPHNSTTPQPHHPTTSESHHSSVYDCTIIEIDKHHSDRKGNITVVENDITIPFGIRRSYYLYDIPGGEERGAHAHKELKQLIIAASGSFDVVLDDGNVKRTFTLNRPYQALVVVPGIWRELNNFSSGSVCLVLASHPYEEEDYIRDYNEFINFKKIKKMRTKIVKVKHKETKEIFELEILEPELEDSENRSMGVETTHRAEVVSISPDTIDDIKVVTIYVYPVGAINYIAFCDEHENEISDYEDAGNHYSDIFGKF